jgi:hypothetical protein
MSVLARNRKESEVEFLNTAFELEKFTVQACHRENVIPKRYRLTLGNRLMESAKIIHNNIVYANTIRVNKKKDYVRRMGFQYKALLEIQIMLKDLRLISELFTAIKDSVLEEWTGLIIKEEALIKGWIKSDTARYSDLE